MKKILMVIVASLLFSSTVFALGVPIKDTEKLIGCWKRNVYSDGDMKRLSKVEFYDEVQQKYQWFCFNPDGSFRVMAANKDMPLADIKEKVKNLPLLMTWKLMSPGIVRIEHKEDSSQNYNWLMSVAVSSETFKGVGINPGEVYMGLINREKTDYSLLRVLSKEK
jgi:hypothetical protein